MMDYRHCTGAHAQLMFIEAGVNSYTCVNACAFRWGMCVSSMGTCGMLLKEFFLV